VTLGECFLIGLAAYWVAYELTVLVLSFRPPGYVEPVDLRRG